MKGPSGKLKFDVRRLWECPVCKKPKWTTGRVVQVASSCCPASDGTTNWMRLVEETPGEKTPIKPEG